MGLGELLSGFLCYGFEFVVRAFGFRVLGLGS